MALKDHIHIVPRYADVLITIGFFKWKGWTYLKDWMFNRHIRIWHFFFALIGSMLGFAAEVFAYPLRAVYRYKPGKLGAGYIITLICVWVILLFNSPVTPSSYLNFTAKSIELIYTVVFKSSYDHLNWQEIKTALWRPQSIFLQWFLIVFIVCAAFNLLGRYFKLKDDNPWSKGTSKLYMWWKGYFKLSQSYYEVLWEPAFTIILGWLVFHFYGDFRFALFLWISSAALFVQEVLDYLMRTTFEK